MLVKLSCRVSCVDQSKHQLCGLRSYSRPVTSHHLWWIRWVIIAVCYLCYAFSALTLCGGCWRGYLSGASCRLAYGPADATASHSSLASVKSRLGLPFWYRLTLVVVDIQPLNVCVFVCVWMAVVSLRVVYVCVGVVKARRRQQMRFWAHAGAVCWYITRTCRRRLRRRKPSTSRSTCDMFCLCLPLSCDFFLAFILRYAPTPAVARPHRYALHKIRYDTRCYFNMRSNADISHLNLLHWTKDKKVEN